VQGGHRPARRFLHICSVFALRIAAAVTLLVCALYWAIGASYEIVGGAKPPGIFGLSLLRPLNPAPVLTKSQWRKGGLFLLALAVVLVGLAIRLLTG
jgi:hypothetical protein